MDLAKALVMRSATVILFGIAVYLWLFNNHAWGVVLLAPAAVLWATAPSIRNHPVFRVFRPLPENPRAPSQPE